MLGPSFPRNERVCYGCVVRGGGGLGQSEYVCGNRMGGKIGLGGSDAGVLLLAEDSFTLVLI